jgi:TfoX/Sxy family transcriptional regulator of competence genes
MKDPALFGRRFRRRIAVAYNAQLAERVRVALAASYPGVVEVRMFGGLSFMLNGHMVCGVVKDDLMVRVGPERYEESLGKPGVRPMDFTGRPLTGMVYVGPDGLRGDEQLEGWVSLGVDFVKALPEKGGSGRRRGRSGQGKGR